MMTPSESGGSGGTRLTLSKRYSAAFNLLSEAIRRPLGERLGGVYIYRSGRLSSLRFSSSISSTPSWPSGQSSSVRSWRRRRIVSSSMRRLNIFVK